MQVSSLILEVVFSLFWWYHLQMHLLESQYLHGNILNMLIKTQPQDFFLKVLWVEAETFHLQTAKICLSY